ncbi:MAG: 4Fe-4S binding protein [bacterium]
MDTKFLNKYEPFPRRDFMKQSMWTALLAWASLNSLDLLVSPTKALAVGIESPVVPKELIFNPNWWKALYAWMMAINEIPLLEDGLATSKEKGDLKYLFDKIRVMGETLNWGTKIVPVQKSIHPKVEILPIHSFEEILRRTRVAGIGECWCRTTFKNCDRPTNTCILLSFGDHLPSLLERDEHVAKVSIEEIREVIRRAEDVGLVHELIRCGDEETFYVICNCCPCCCVGLRGLIEFGNRLVVKADFIAEINDNCNGCGECLERCYFSARTIENGRCVVNMEKCMGCGLCATRCPYEGTFLVKRTGSDQRTD